ncbi:MAG: dihydrofolate reductase family protein [Alphaproteobacteria bacterium]
MNNFYGTMLAVTSLDGYLAKDTDDLIKWSSAEDKAQLYDFVAQQSDVFIVGRKTYEIIGEKGEFKGHPALVLTRSVDGVQKSAENKWLINPAVVSIADFLEENGFRKPVVLGGASVYTYCLESGLIDEIRLTVEPIVFGKGIALFTPLTKDQKLLLIEKKQLNAAGTILLRYGVES